MREGGKVGEAWSDGDDFGAFEYSDEHMARRGGAGATGGADGRTGDVTLGEWAVGKSVWDVVRMEHCTETTRAVVATGHNATDPGEDVSSI